MGSADLPAQRLFNQFNFAERATQTADVMVRSRGTNTDPPPRANFSGLATQWSIFDAYTAHMEQQRRAKEKSKGRGRRGAGRGGGGGGAVSDDEDEEAERAAAAAAAMAPVSHEHVNTLEAVYNHAPMRNSAKIIERMVNLNLYKGVANDYKYLEWKVDELDNYEDSGSLMPLWEFDNALGKTRHVTSIVWNPQYSGMALAAVVVGGGWWEVGGWV